MAVIEKPWTPVSPELLCPPTRTHLCNGEAVCAAPGSPSHSPLMAFTAQQSLLPTVDSFELLSFAQTVSCPVTSSELKSLDIRDVEARVQQFLFQPPFGWLGSPTCSLILPWRIQCNTAF